MANILNCIIIVLMMTLLSCKDSDSNTDPGSTYTYSQPSSALCDHFLDLPDGFICALQPSRIDPLAMDVAGPSGGDALLGFGYHAIAFPKNNFNPQNVYVHFTGTFGRPYSVSSSEFGSLTFLEESLSSGYIMIQPAYNNRFAVNSSDECAGNTTVDNCAGKVRLEKIKGTDESSVTTVNVADSIETRIIKIIEYFESNGFNFPQNFVSGSTLNWSRLYLGGHSQGSGHALYIGKNFGARNVCVLGGTYDVADSVPSVPAENMADWLLDSNFVMSKSNIKAFLTVEDSSYASFSSALSFVNITTNAVSSPPYFDADSNSINGHAAPIQDPKFSTERASACFVN